MYVTSQAFSSLEEFDATLGWPQRSLLLFLEWYLLLEWNYPPAELFSILSALNLLPGVFLLPWLCMTGSCFLCGFCCGYSHMFAWCFSISQNEQQWGLVFLLALPFYLVSKTMASHSTVSRRALACMISKEILIWLICYLVFCVRRRTGVGRQCPGESWKISLLCLQALAWRAVCTSLTLSSLHHTAVKQSTLTLSGQDSCTRFFVPTELQCTSLSSPHSDNKMSATLHIISYKFKHDALSLRDTLQIECCGLRRLYMQLRKSTQAYIKIH